MGLDQFPWFGQFAIASTLCSQIDNDRTRSHRLDHFFGDQFGGFFPGNGSGGDDDIDVLGLLAEQCHFCFDEFLAHHLCVTTSTFSLFIKFEFQKLGPHALDFILDRRARIKRPHNRSQVFCGTNRRKSGNPGSDHQNFRRWNFTRCGDLSGKQPAKEMGRFDHRTVARDIGH